jgi:hypothetical protein
MKNKRKPFFSQKKEERMFSGSAIDHLQIYYYYYYYYLEIYYYYYYYLEIYYVGEKILQLNHSGRKQMTNVPVKTVTTF